MKKTIALTLALMLLLAGISALALSPQTPAILKKAVAGQTFIARCNGYESSGDNFSVYVQLYEYARYSEADIQAIEGTDYIDADVGSAMVYSVTPGDDGYVLNESDPNAAPVYLVPDGEGSFFAKDADGNYFLTEALQFACAVTADTQFIDASDPGAEPVVHTAQELIDALRDDRSSFQNIEITFNDDGELAVLQLNPAA